MVLRVEVLERGETEDTKTVLCSVHDIVTVILVFILCAITILAILSITSSQTLYTEVQLKMEKLSSLKNVAKNITVKTKNLNQSLTESLNNISLMTAENERLNLQILNEQKSNPQMKAEIKAIHSILSSARMKVIWEFCNQSTLECKNCPDGWSEHGKHCFLMPAPDNSSLHPASNVKKSWEDARLYCVKQSFGADLAVVRNKEAQGFLTDMAIKFYKDYPKITGTNETFSAWIGLTDMIMENNFTWVSGDELQNSQRFWISGEPNDKSPPWEEEKTEIYGQDCVGIVPKEGGKWDDMHCTNMRAFICETKSFVSASVDPTDINSLLVNEIN